MVITKHSQIKRSNVTKQKFVEIDNSGKELIIYMAEGKTLGNLQNQGFM